MDPDTVDAGAAGSGTPRTCLVTVTYNGAADWDDFHRSVLAQDDPDWRLVVVDNASGDGTVERLRAVTDPRVHVILNDGNVGVAAGNNQGVRHALALGAEHVLLINNDTEFAPTLLSTLHETRRRLAVEAVTPLIAFHSDPGRIWYGGGVFKRRGGVRNVHTHWNEPVGVVGPSAFETGYAPTTALMVDSGVFARVGLMDERYFVYWDDADFVRRLAAAGVRIVVEPRAVLLHKASSSTGGMESDFSLRYMNRNRILFTRKFHGRRWAVYTAGHGVAEGLRRLVRGREGPHQTWVRVRAIAEGFALRSG